MWERRFMTHLAERSLSTPDNPGSNPAIGNLRRTFIYCQRKLRDEN